MTVTILVLAAGLSRRMGAQDKLAMDLGGKPLLHYPIEAALSSEVDAVYLVTNDASASAQHPEVTCIAAPDAPLGQGHSLKAGFQALCGDPGLSGALVMLGDMPFVTAAHINTLLEQASKTPHDVCRFMYADTPGHPVYWPARLFEQIAALAGDTGARSVLQANRGQVREIPSSDDAVIFDVDTPERLAAARRRVSEAR